MRDEADGPLGRIGRRHEFAQGVEHLLQLGAGVAAEGVVVAKQLYDIHGTSRYDEATRGINGLVTTLTYDARGRLIRRDAGGQVMTHTYHPAGMPLRTTLADGSWIENAYDPAHRLVGMLDSAGNRVRYTLDSQGNRETQEHFDGAGVSRYFRGFQYDNDRRLVAEIDAQGQYAVRHAYDQNGNRSSTTDASGRTTAVNHDPLNRRDTMTDADGGVTRSAYDARDNLVQVTDPINVTTAYTYDGLDNLIRETSPTSGVNTYGYDSAGNQTTRTWANGKTAVRAFDALSRLRAEAFGGTAQVNYVYDAGPNAIGRLSAISDPVGQTTWAFDPWGRILGKSRDTAGRILTTAYTYDQAGRLSSMSYPSGRSLTYGYDAAGRVSGIGIDGAGLIGGIEWQPFADAPIAWSQPNGRSVSRVIDRNGRHVEYSFEASWRDLTRDADGRIITQLALEDLGPGPVATYGYDAAERLSSETRRFGNRTETRSYVYDRNGNRTSMTTSGTGTSQDGVTHYGYAGNVLGTLSGAQTGSLGHDASGNLVADGSASFVYDERNRLAQVPGASYGYDGQGLRVVKNSTAQGTRYFVHGANREVLGEYDATTPVYETVYLGSVPIAVLKGGQTYWIDADHLDTPRSVSNGSRQAVWRWESDAFGSTPADENPNGLGSFEFNQRFPGQVFDRESGLHYNDQRDYAPRLGRYVQSDPIGLAGGINTYAYASSNPVARADPTGLLDEGDVPPEGGGGWCRLIKTILLSPPILTQPDGYQAAICVYLCESFECPPKRWVETEVSYWKWGCQSPGRPGRGHRGPTGPTR